MIDHYIIELKQLVSPMATTVTKNHQVQQQYDQLHDQATQLKSFEDSNLGVKGISDSCLKTIPSIFIHESNHRPQLLKTSELLNTSFTLPVIDLQCDVSDDDVLHVTNNSAFRDRIVQQVKEAAEIWSIFRVVNHGIPQRVLDDVIAGAKNFHEQDDEIKKRMYSRDSSKRVSFSSNYNISSGRPLDWRDTLSCLVSPYLPADEFPSICRDALVEYTKQVKKLGVKLLEILSNALGLKKTHLEEMGCAERICILGNYYPPCPQPELTLGASSHADSGFLTILLQDHVEGLQLLLDDQWLDVPPMRGSLIINMGYLMQLISNDKFKSVTHRVIAPKETRVSVAALFRTHYDRGDDKHVFGPIKDLITDENPVKYRDVTVEEYVKCLYSKPLEMSSVLDFFRI